MKTEIKQNCIWISEADSPATIFANGEKLLEQITQQECVMLIVEPGDSFEMPQDTDQCEAIAEFFKEIPVLTVIADTALEKAELSALLLFDIRLGCSDYVISKGTVLSGEEQKRYEILCGEKEFLKYNAFEKSGSADLIAAGLIRKLPQSDDFHKEVQSYIKSLIGDKTSFQTKAVVSCLVQARTGESERVLNEESRQFYRLMKAKTEESANGTE
ncbi:MAG: hypothetical protein ACI4RC_06755 [Oscillospiraceae bacterium]